MSVRTTALILQGRLVLHGLLVLVDHYSGEVDDLGDDDGDVLILARDLLLKVVLEHFVECLDPLVISARAGQHSQEHQVGEAVLNQADILIRIRLTHLEVGVKEEHEGRLGLLELLTPLFIVFEGGPELIERNDVLLVHVLLQPALVGVEHHGVEGQVVLHLLKAVEPLEVDVL
eukprot:CAMPEP_0168618498 /NCGR_PEP_ID=MMETSP0449_2-20121227/6104_1 /TAXON_ID=1082188 /ORGANISM="Strombidium rassoulzadegani, Strain ras09" /LENGTH=173 /DNA_ID=CAMNT_0008659377 /DNA_START=345 /DNA_END=863 /DNA_ORIENTATION=+